MHLGSIGLHEVEMQVHPVHRGFQQNAPNLHLEQGLFGAERLFELATLDLNECWDQWKSRLQDSIYSRS